MKPEQDLSRRSGTFFGAGRDYCAVSRCYWGSAGPGPGWPCWWNSRMGIGGRGIRDADPAEFRIPQVCGDPPRSMGVEGVTESLLTRYGVPLTLLSPQVSAAVLVAYVGHVRFRMPKNAPVLDVRAMAEASGGAIAAERAAADFGPLHEEETPRRH